MKKKILKISLNRETLRQLDADPLSRAEGGVTTIDASNCPGCSGHPYCQTLGTDC